MSGQRIRVAVVGLEFGGNVVAPYAAHPNVEYVGLCDTDPAAVARASRRFNISRTHGSLEEVIACGQYDAVNLFTPIPQHAEQACRCLLAGLHVASAVPMATTLDDCRAIVAACRKSGRNYMMMETSVTSPEFFYLRDQIADGMFGDIQFMRGRFYHNLENHPRYWQGLPPMHYTTHPVSPMLALAGTRAVRVNCIGSGSMRRELRDVYGQPWPVQTAVFRLAKPGLAMEVTSVTFETAVEFQESFDIYGSKRSFRWAGFRTDKHAIVELHAPLPDGPKSSPTTVMRLDSLPATFGRLPRELRGVQDRQASLPHLCHEFIRSIVENRKPWIDEIAAANWTAPGLCAHQSALAGGDGVDVPSFA